MARYSYAIIKENYRELERESTLLDNNYKASKKYALIEKQCFDDGSETINRIVYDNDLYALQRIAEGYVSWYNYPTGVTKNIQGYISNI